MAANSVKKIQEFGQSIWLDYIRRGMLESGELKRLIIEDGLRGVTVNPSILEKAIAGSHDYDEEIRTLALEGYQPPRIYETLAVEDVRSAAEVFYPIFEETQGKHGFVSLEVSPHLAHDTEGTIAEAHRFWQELDYPNVMIKVPATVEGLPAIEQLIEDGINVNVTLLFGLQRYHEVVNAYLKGLYARLVNGKPISHISSVASFFLSRIDVLVDPLLINKIKHGGDDALLAAKSQGQVAISSARIAYQVYKEMFSAQRYLELADEGAHPQRLLWASTSTKNPEYSDVMYVDSLIGKDTVNTIPMRTLNAYREHGDPQARLENNIEAAQETLEALSQLDIDIDQVAQQLEDEGVDKFIRSYDNLMKILLEKRKSSLGIPVDYQVFDLGKYRPVYTKRLKNLERSNFVDRLWTKDTSLWKDDPKAEQVIQNSLGWLHVAEEMEDNLPDLFEFKDEVESAGYKHVVLLGMGGSSLAPMVLADIVKSSREGLAFDVLDTSVPESILKLEQILTFSETLFIVASKSGTTAETLALANYFYSRLTGQFGNKVGDHFIAITDPGSPLVDFATEKNFRRTFLNFQDIGGRYSALSYFGLVPALLMGIDISTLLERALRMENACASCVPSDENPGVMLGAALGELALQGRDKVTILAPRSLAKFGLWVEQLIAESTGKEGRGLLPVVAESIAQPEFYGNDRLFVVLRWRNQADSSERNVQYLLNSGFPVITILLDDAMDLGQEFFRWEIAVATAGSILRINAFDQPNVQESKTNTNQILEMIRQGQEPPYETPTLVDGSIEVYSKGSVDDLGEALEEFLAQGITGDFISLMAYITENQETQEYLQELRLHFRELTHLATTVGFGPRFLHSTGQYHKGGPNNGLFLQLTADQQHDLNIPGQPFTFGKFLEAQALGDFQALRRHGRCVMRIHLGKEVEWGLWVLNQVLKAESFAAQA
ncbi:MAG: bifunctional transaldolase/phosoglucose isomerase [Anaerolineales bacterium]|jgi:transaldolase/glucose-6-phosphate isomerase